jgi:hypothetical protein
MDMSLFRSKAGRPMAAVKVDPDLPDGAWWQASEEMYRERVEGFYGSPETIASGGEEHYLSGDFGTAVFFYAKAIDMLHTAYGFAEMARRQPSAADLTIVDGFCNSLGAAIDLHPAAPVDERVREVTHRLRSISSECDRVGLSSVLYRQGLGQIAAYAPDVPTDDVLWT